MPKDLSVLNKTLGLQQLSENRVPQFPFCVCQHFCAQFLLLDVISYRIIQRQERGEKNFSSLKFSELISGSQDPIH